jgi:hypothetical protein
MESRFVKCNLTTIALALLLMESIGIIYFGALATLISDRALWNLLATAFTMVEYYFTYVLVSASRSLGLRFQYLFIRLLLFLSAAFYIAGLKAMPSELILAGPWTEVSSLPLGEK